MSERGDEAGGQSESAQELLVGMRHMAPDGRQLGPVGPDILRRDDEAGIVDGLEGEIDVPTLIGAARPSRVVLLPSPGSRGRARRVGRPDFLILVVRWRDDPKAGPHGFDIRAPRGVPHGKSSGQFTHSSSSHPLMAPSGEARALTRRRRRSPWSARPRPSRGRADQGPGPERPSSAHDERAQDFVAGFGSLLVERRRVRLDEVRPPERGRKRPHQRFDPAAVTPVDQRAPAALHRPATNSRSGSSRPRARNSTTIATAWAAKRTSERGRRRRAFPRRRSIASPHRRSVQRNFAAADGSRTYPGAVHDERCASAAGARGDRPGRVVEARQRAGNRAVLRRLRELQRELDVLLLEEVRRHGAPPPRPRPVADGQDRGRRDGARPAPGTTSASGRSSPVLVLRPKRQTT